MDLRLRSMFTDPAARERLGLPALEEAPPGVLSLAPSEDTSPAPALSSPPAPPVDVPGPPDDTMDRYREAQAADRATREAVARSEWMSGLLGRRMDPARLNLNAAGDVAGEAGLRERMAGERRAAELFGPQLALSRAKAQHAPEEAAADVEQKRQHAALFGQQAHKGALDLADAEAFREALRNGDSRATAVVLSLAKRYNPDLAAKLEGATGAEVYPLLPTMTRNYAAEQAAARAEAILQDRQAARRDTATRAEAILQDRQAARRDRPPKALQTADKKTIDELAGEIEAVGRLEGQFKPEFAGGGPLGGATTSLYQTLGSAGSKGMQETAAFWADFSRLIDLPQRNAVFGASLSAGEKGSWEGAKNIKPGSDPALVRRKLAEMRGIMSRKLGNIGASLAEEGYDPEAISKRSGGLVGEAKPSGARSGSVTVMWKGKPKAIPADKLQDALKAGATEVK